MSDTQQVLDAVGTMSRVMKRALLHARDHGVLPHGRELLSLIHRGLVERTSTKDNITLTQLGHMAATHIEGEGA